MKPSTTQQLRFPSLHIVANHNKFYFTKCTGRTYEAKISWRVRYLSTEIEKQNCFHILIEGQISEFFIFPRSSHFYRSFGQSSFFFCEITLVGFSSNFWRLFRQFFDDFLMIKIKTWRSSQKMTDRWRLRSQELKNNSKRNSNFKSFVRFFIKKIFFCLLSVPGNCLFSEFLCEVGVFLFWKLPYGRRGFSFGNSPCSVTCTLLLSLFHEHTHTHTHTHTLSLSHTRT